MFGRLDFEESRVEPQQLFDLTGRVAVVIGGTGVLGSAMGRGLAAAGAQVVLAGRNAERGAQHATTISSAGHQAVFEACDATSRMDLESLRDRVAARWQQIDILVNAAGVNSATPFLNIADDELDRILTVNFRSVFVSCQVFGHWWLERRCSASMINVGSISGLNPLSRVFTYSASKAAVHNLTRNLAREWASAGIRVNTLVPGFFPAEQNRAILKPERVADILRHTPLGRFGEPDELIGAVLLLASDAGRFITGTELIVDGGFQAVSV